MKVARAWFGAVVVWALSGLAACNGDLVDETVAFPSPTVELSTVADASAVRQGQLLPLTIFVSDDVYLVEPTVLPPAEFTADAAYLVLTLDDESSTPLLVTAQRNVIVTIPPSTPEGGHTIRCRVYTHDGMPTGSTAELDINVVTPVEAPVDTSMDTSFPQPAPPPPPQPIS